MISTQEVVLRLLAAVILCGAVGLQRALAGKVAGMRTHILVGLGAAIFTLISGYAFHTTAANADRIAAQVVTGIGFISGGAILKEQGAVKGITTAASLWTVTALGMAAGAGLYTLGVAGAVAVLATLVALRYVEQTFPRRRYKAWELRLILAADATATQVMAALAPQVHRHWLISLSQDEATQITLGVETLHHFDIEAITATLRSAGAQSVAWHAAAFPEEY